MSAVRIVESSGSIGSLQVADGSGGFLSGSLIAGSNISIADDGSGNFTLGATGGAGSGTIGDAEDGDYTDGLFVDFTTSTAIGTAVDRFNEILKALAPSPAPRLDDINTSDSGITARLAFGSSNNQESETPAYFSVGGGAGIESAVDAGSEYAPTGDKRIGIFTTLRDINGRLNEDVVANVQGGGVTPINYPAYSFGDADQGNIVLEVNGVDVITASFTDNAIGAGGSGLGTDDSNVNGNGSGFLDLSAATTGTFSNGNEFATFKHRTGEYIVKAADQRQGWNYARVKHIIGGTTTSTNFIEWVNDTSSDAITATGNSIEFEGSGSVHLSGVEYFQSGTVTYKVRVNNAYKYIYRNSDTIQFNETSSPSLSGYAFTNLTKADHPFGAGDTQDKVLHLTASDAVAPSTFINGTVGCSINVTHPNTAKNLSTGGSSSTTGILIFDQTTTSTNTVENFNFENYRIVSGAYNTQNDVTHNSNVWDSKVFITASNGGHSNGLQFFDSELRAPRNTTNSGDFRDNSDGGSLNNAPSENPNYSGQTSGQRTFYRWFQNKDGVTHNDMSIAINGSSTIVPNTSALDASKIRVFVKIPGVTGWMDAARQFVLDSYQDNDGAYVDNEYLNFDNSLNATNYLNFGNVGVADDDYIVLRIEADSSWTGNVSQISVNIGAGTGTLHAVPNLDNINVEESGVTAKLSFDDSKTIVEYSAVETGAGFSDVNLNGLYEAPSGGTDYRRGVFDGTVDITGHLNNTTSANLKSYEAKAFADANSGSLKLEVNGSVIHEVEITGSFDLVGAGVPGVDSPSGNSLNAATSGFTNMSVWEPGKFATNGVPRYSEIYRLAKYKIDTNDQRQGWNYARVIHTVGGADRQTNYVEWINDISGSTNDIAFANLEAKKFGDNDVFHLSGVKYFVSPSGSFGVTADKIYTNVYSHESDAITISNHSGISSNTCTNIEQVGAGVNNTENGSSGNTAALATLISSADTEKELLHVTASCNVSHTKSLSGSFVSGGDSNKSVALRFNFKHPLKNSSGEATSTVTATNFLIFSASDDSGHVNEYFNGEQFRIQSGSYANEASVTAVSNVWSSTGSLNDNSSFPNYYSGLMVYDGKLISPLKGGDSGNFRNKQEASNAGPFEGPDNNVNYSTLGESTREYFRYFINPTTNDVSRIGLTIKGDAILATQDSGHGNTGTLGSNKNIYVQIKVPDSAQAVTEFMDCNLFFDSNPGETSGVETDGCFNGSQAAIDKTVDSGGATNEINLGRHSVRGTTNLNGPDTIVLRIRAHKDWTGYLSEININWSV